MDERAKGSAVGVKYLHLMSIFPALTETFVLREVRKMRQMGCEVVIGQLRSIRNTPATSEFEDLRPYVVRAQLVSLSTLAGTLFFIFKKPKVMWTCIRLVAASFPR